MRLGIFFLVLVSFLACQKKETKTTNTAPVTETTETEVDDEKKAIIFFGNSITAGYQLDLSEAFPAVIGKIVDSLKLDYRVVNAGLSGETTASGNSRVGWVLKNKVDIFVLELGANDGLRGISTEETRKNLQSIIDKVKAKYPRAKIILAGMQIPPNLGQTYSDEFKNIYPDLAERNQIALIPFILEGVAGESDLNLEDGIHPTPGGHKILADNVWKVLQPLL
ncbi:MAG: arylesterase [Cyclobacteriaceae bacterium]